MTEAEFGATVLAQMPFEPTDQQVMLVAALARFCSSHAPQDSVFVLNGYAGTGKTSVMGALVRALGAVNIPTVLLASTGRAAKVFAGFTGVPVQTIHRKIYQGVGQNLQDGMGLTPTLRNNPHENTIFIVDEASMIGDGSGDAPGHSLLEDLIEYVYTGLNCRLILLGDTAQLPPVGSSESPAMNPAKLKAAGLRVTRAVMTRTVRQKSRSGILHNATWLRRAMTQNPLPDPQLTVTQFPDMHVVSPEELEDELKKSFARYGEEQTIMITRSNRRAVDFNLAIRRMIFDREEVLTRGERLIISKNNYHWARNVEGMEFAANGEPAIVEKVYATEQRDDEGAYADVRLHFPDQGVSMDCKLNLDSLTAPEASLTPQQTERIALGALADAGLTPEASKTARAEALRKSPYWNAIQARYAYAVTCHKAQGGQWASVFVDMGYIPPEAYHSLDFYRWLYTAVSRSTQRLSLVNPSVEIK